MNKKLNKRKFKIFHYVYNFKIKKNIFSKKIKIYNLNEIITN